MKRVLALCFLLAVSAAMAGESWKLKGASAWSRDEGKTALASMDGGWGFRHTGEKDWAIHGIGVIAAKPGDVFTFTCTLAAPKDGAPQGTAVLSAVLRDAKGEAIHWAYASKGYAAPAAGTLAAGISFLVPEGAVSVEPRLMGDGPAAFGFRDAVLERTGNRLPDPAAVSGEIALAGKGISVAVFPKACAIRVKDERTGRVWEPVEATSRFAIAAKKEGNAAVVTVIDPETLAERTFTVEPKADAAEVLVTVTGEGPMSRSFDCPAPFASRKGDRLIVPMNEGIGFPVDEEHQGLYRLISYGGHGICMAFFGMAEDATGGGWMCVLETADDAAMMPVRKDGLWTAGPSWDAQKGQFGYARKARYVFFDQGGYVAMAKYYRGYAKEQGKLVTFTEKAKARPLVDRLLGAANIWYMGGGDKVALVKEMQALGMQRILWSASGSSGEVKAMHELPDVLVSRYDIYQDVNHPEQRAKLGIKGFGNNGEAWPEDINWAGPTSNDWRKAWGIKAKDGTWTYCAMMCDKCAPEHARRNISAELKNKPFNTRFIDTTVAAPWQECWNPAHPMTRSDSRVWKMKLLNVISGEFGLVCGSETGHDASVPYCDYFEGMLSLGPYRVPDSGRDMMRVWDDVPAVTAKYQVGEKYRLPLWELVYHDCVVSQWYWGDYNNKLPKLWRKRDLFNALYGTPPMYMFDGPRWNELKEKFAASYKVAEPVSRLTGYSEMLDHRILSPDRSVQQTSFANGTVVTVDFAKETCEIKTKN